MPRSFVLPFIQKKKDYKPKFKEPYLSENKRNKIWKDRKGHIIKRKGKFKNSDMIDVHFWCHICGRVEASEAIDSGVQN